MPSNTSERTEPQALTEREAQPMRMPPTDSEAWERFEAISTLPQRSPLPTEQQFEIANYDVDTGVFAVNRFAENFHNNSGDFSFEQSSLRHSGADSSGEIRNNSHTKLNFYLGEEGTKPQLGVRLIIPFGN